MSKTKKRPVGVTFLAILAGVAGVLAVVHVLQSLGILPFFIGAFTMQGFSLWSAMMWGLMAWVWFWLVQMLWNMDEQAWLFLAVTSTFNLIVDFSYLVGRADWTDVSISFLVNSLILVYIMLPSVRQAFGRH